MERSDYVQTYEYVGRMQHCECGGEDRAVTRTIPWQEDVCRTCGLPIKGSALQENAGRGS